MLLTSRLAKTGPHEFSIPTLAQRTAINRASVYQFFPTKYAIFNALAERYVTEFMGLVAQQFAPTSHRHWRTAVAALIELGGDFYAARPAARRLLLGGAITSEIDTAHETTNQKVAQFARSYLEERFGLRILPHDPDPYFIAVEAVNAVYAASQQLHGEITCVYIVEAQRIAQAYLGVHLVDARRE